MGICGPSCCRADEAAGVHRGVSYDKRYYDSYFFIGETIRVSNIRDTLRVAQEACLIANLTPQGDTVAQCAPNPYSAPRTAILLELTEAPNFLDNSVA